MDSLNPNPDTDPDPAFLGNPDTDPGFDDRELKKMQLEFFVPFFDQKLQFTYL